MVEFRDVVKKYTDPGEALGRDPDTGDVTGLVPGTDVDPVEVVTDPAAQAALSATFGRYSHPVAAGMRWRPAMSSPGQAAMSVNRVALCGVFATDQACTVTSMFVEVTTPGDGSAVIRLGTALLDGPTVSGQALTEHGAVDGTVAGIHSLPVGRPMTPGSRLAILALTNGENTTPPTVWAGIPALPNVDAGSDINVTRYRTLLSTPVHTGAMPATVPSLTVGGISGIPTVGLLIGA